MLDFPYRYGHTMTVYRAEPPEDSILIMHGGVGNNSAVLSDWVTVNVSSAANGSWCHVNTISGPSRAFHQSAVYMDITTEEHFLLVTGGLGNDVIKSQGPLQITGTPVVPQANTYR